MTFPDNPVDGDFHRLDDGTYFKFREDPPGWLRFYGDPPLTVMPLSDARAKLEDTVRGVCADTILNGFTFEVDGVATTYGSSTVDQMNYISAAVGGGHLWSNIGGTWALQYHSPDEASQVVQEFSKHRSMCSLALLSTVDAIQEANTTEALVAINYLAILAQVKIDNA